MMDSQKNETKPPSGSSLRDLEKEFEKLKAQVKRDLKLWNKLYPVAR
jgi:hypothetical protein